MNNSAFNVPTAISSLPTLISSIDLSTVSDDTHLRDLLRSIRTCQRSLDGLAMKVVSRADQLESRGSGVSGLDISLDLGQVSAQQARTETKRSKTIVAIPSLLEAVVSGDTSSEHVDSVAKHFNKLTDEQKNRLDQAEIVEAATSMPADTFNNHMKRVVDKIRDDYGLKDTVEKQKASEFRHWFNKKTGMGVFSGQLDPIRYEAFSNAIDAHTNTLAITTTKSDGKTDKKTISKDPNLAASALFELVTSSRSIKQRLPHISVIVDQKTLETGCHQNSVRQTAIGTELPPETIERLCCDSVLQKVVHDNKNIPINVGRKYRTATDAQWTAIKSIYTECAWSNCDRRLNWCQLHHIKEWETGGPTNLNNLVPLCSQHHHKVHEGKWTIKLKPDRTLKIWKPDGKHWTITDPPTREPNQKFKNTVDSGIGEISSSNMKDPGIDETGIDEKRDSGIGAVEDSQVDETNFGETKDPCLQLI